MRAVLGPTNTGKTHLAIERMCGHSSGMMGFPLRLLAREVYDRVRAIKGDKQVALLQSIEGLAQVQRRQLAALMAIGTMLSALTSMTFDPNHFMDDKV